MIKIKFHSIVDVITNSSTVIFTYQDSVTQAKELVAEVLKLSGVEDKTPDDLFHYGIFCDEDQYLEDIDDDEIPEDMPEITGAYGSDERKESEKIQTAWFNGLLEKIIKGEIEQPEWMGKKETNYDDYSYSTYLYLIPKSDEYNELGKRIQKLLGTVIGMAKTIFTIKPHSVIDVITNSSSELFVSTGVDKKAVTELIKNVYPDYKNEYDEVKSIDQLSLGELDSYLWYYTSPRCSPATKSQYGIPNGFTFDELLEPESDKPAWNGELQYQLKNNKKSESKYDTSFVTEENKAEIINKLDPNRTMYFLYSLDENPNWEMQEKLSDFMKRFHLG